MITFAKAFTHSLAALGLAATATAPALAANAAVQSITVSTNDLDLGTAKGQRMLDKRVEKAVRSVCRTTSVQTGTRIMSEDARACLAKARIDARQQVASMTARYEQRGG